MKKLVTLAAVILMLVSVSGYAAEEYNGYIVKLKDDCPSFEAQRLYALSEGNESDDYIIVSEENIDSVDMSAVEYILPNYKLIPMDFTPNDTYYGLNAQWNMDIIKVQYAWNKGCFGREKSGGGNNVRIAVIDTGIDIDHPDLAGRIVAAENYVEGTDGVVDPDNISENSDDKHGTSVAGAAAAIANNGIGTAGVSQADIVALRVCYTNEIKTAIEDAVSKYDCDVINISMGVCSKKFEYAGSSHSTEEEYMQAIADSMNYYLGEPIRQAAQSGVIVVASSGNYGESGKLGYEYPDNPIVYPACCDNVISVGAVGSVMYYEVKNGIEYPIFTLESDKKKISSFSTYNNMVDVVAPGVWIYVPTGKYTESDEYYGHLSGTSFSSPQVAAAAAIIKGIDPDIDHDGFETLLRFSAEDLGDSGKDDYYGWGLLNIEKMVKIANDEELGTGEPKYNGATNTLTLTYANFGAATGGESIRVAVYDSNDMLVSITSAKTLSQANSGEPIVDIDVEGIEIPDGGYAKAYCMSDWTKMKSIADVAEYKN